MPIACIGAILCDVLFNLKYVGCTYKVTVAIASFGNIVWICPLAPGTSADVLIWDREGPKRVASRMVNTRGAVTWYGPLSVERLTERQKEYNDVHGFYRARIEHLFARMWHWGIVRNIWRGSGTELHEYVRALLHLQQFLIRRQVRYPPYGPWEHLPAHVWAAPTQEDDDDEDVVGEMGMEVPFVAPRLTLRRCPCVRSVRCNIDTHTCDNITVL